MTPAQRVLASVCMAACAISASAQTVAYFNFEEGSDALEVNSVGSSNATGSLTVAGGGDGTNGMVAYSINASPNYSSTVPVTSHANFLSMQFDGGDDLYQPNPAGSTLDTTTFTDFTIEAFVNFNSVSGFQTIVGHDDNGNPGSGTGPTSLFYLSKGGGAGFRVELITASNTDVQVNTTEVPTLNTWYHVAAVGDATAGTLTLYVNGVQVGQTTGYDGMLPPSIATTSWTIGRGQYNGNPADDLNGYIDDVRFTASVLSPSQFLNVPEPSTYAILAGLLGLGFALRRRRA